MLFHHASETRSFPSRPAPARPKLSANQIRPWLLTLAIAAMAPWGSRAAESPAPDVIGFNQHIRPVLSENCFHCHGPDEATREAGLRLDEREPALEAGAFVPGDPAASELIRRITSDDSRDLMPPPGSHRELSPEQRDLLARWIEQGAVYEKHWAFVAPERPQVPGPAAGDHDAPDGAAGAPPAGPAGWHQGAIDRFLWQGMQANDLQPSPQADRRTLIRRLSLDLTGLPPAPGRVREFVEDDRPDAWQRLVDELLDSPHFGERMALEWLDAARYADSNGFQADGDRQNWPWRDWVVRAFNDNMPFDRFTIEQLAGDLLPDPTRDQLVATAFNRNHVINGEGGNIAEEQRVMYVIDRVHTTATVWLGLTMACAQCHDHKYDPVSHAEYFQFYAYFNNIAEDGNVNVRRNGGRVQLGNPVVEAPDDEQARALARLREQRDQLESKINQDAGLAAAVDGFVTRVRDGDPALLEELPQEVRDAVTAEERDDGAQARLREHVVNSEAEGEPWREVQQQLAETRGKLDSLDAEIPRVMIMRDRDDPRPTHVLDRGAYDAPLEQVHPGVPSVLPPLPDEVLNGNGRANNRLALAEWLVAPEQPLTARVVMNRLWQQFFGAGLVRTPEDFGYQGALPTHPELLDWLAVEFVESGWDMKHMIRLLLTSEAYRQSSLVNEDLLERDPENLWWARAERFRLPSTVLRDQALALGDLLLPELGGPPVYPYQPPGLWEDFSFGKIRYPAGSGEQLQRRSLYTFWRRSLRPANFFDTASRQICEVEPSRTNTPLQALVMLNDVTWIEAARGLAAAVARDADPDRPEPVLDAMFERVLARPADDTERELLRRSWARALEHYQDQPDAAGELLAAGELEFDLPWPEVPMAALSQVAHLLLNHDETLNRE